MPNEATHLLIVNVDIQDSGLRDNPDRLLIREILYSVVRAGFDGAGISSDQVGAPGDCGDGVLLLVPPVVAKARVVGPWIEHLRQALAARNRPLREPVRLRVGVHAGEAHTDEHGVSGLDINIAFRLASCEQARAALRAVPAADVVVAVSDLVYQSVVRHRGPFIDPQNYRRAEIDTHEYAGPVWLHLPGHSRVPDPDAGSTTDAAGLPRPDRRPGDVNTVGRDGNIVVGSTVRDVYVGRRERDRDVR